MAISKRPNGKYAVFCYDPRLQRKVYVGQRDKKRGPGGAEQLERDAKRQMEADVTAQPAPRQVTCGDYADRWLDVKHGKGTKRPAKATRYGNRIYIQTFLTDHRDRPLASIERREALDWAGKHPNAARAVAAMFADAVDDQVLDRNVFAARGHKQPRGRRDIVPLTESEVDELARIAVDVWGEYGRVCAGWLLFLAWTGCRPAEAFAATWADVDLEAGAFRVTRCKPPYKTQTVILPPRAAEALAAMPVGSRGRDGLLFTTVTGRKLSKGSWSYYWNPVRHSFLSRLAERDPQRRADLLGGETDIDLYSLRHFCASWLVENGVNEFDGSYQLGNSPEVFRETYLHVHEDAVRDRLRLTFDRSRGGRVVALDAVRRGA